MSDKDIPKAYIEAWRFGHRHKDAPLAPFVVSLVDFVVWALALAEQNEFLREHHNDKTYCSVCQQRDVALKTLIGRYDPRHTWTLDQFQQAARERLEASRERGGEERPG